MRTNPTLVIRTAVIGLAVFGVCSCSCGSVADDLPDGEVVRDGAGGDTDGQVDESGGSCSHPAFEEADQLHCSQVAERWYRQIEALKSFACSEDSDCVLVDTGARCLDGSGGERITLPSCGAVARESAEEFDAAREELERALCACRPPPCVASGLCEPPRPVACSEGRCVTR